MENKVKNTRMSYLKTRAIKNQYNDALKGAIGIYLISNIINNHKYIGQSMDILKRIKYHKRDLERGKHFNKYLQNAWNKYGGSSFKFSVLETCKIIELSDKEQYWIERLKPEYNIVKNVYEFYAYKTSESDYPDGYKKDGETFSRPKWHLWVYGGSKFKQGEEN